MNFAPDRAFYLAGATAVGKSAVALELAERLDGEIVSVDSMQVYRGLDLGTAKPTPAERARVPHHLIDVVDLTGRFDAAAFVRKATEEAAALQSRGRVPVFCGEPASTSRPCSAGWARPRQRMRISGPNSSACRSERCWRNWRNTIRSPSNASTGKTRAA